MHERECALEIASIKSLGAATQQRFSVGLGIHWAGGLFGSLAYPRLAFAALRARSGRSLLAGSPIAHGAFGRRSLRRTERLRGL
jgi:hypothetical protein